MDSEIDAFRKSNNINDPAIWSTAAKDREARAMATT
jgi:hypothetical protein